MDQDNGTTGSAAKPTGKPQAEGSLQSSRQAQGSEVAEAGENVRQSGPTEILARVRAFIEKSDVESALRYLNGRTRFRFTGIFQVEPPLLRNVRLFDRENPKLNVSGAVAQIDVGYCGIACEARAPFYTPDARHDERLGSHPARNSMISYAGVPLRMPSGIAWGTLCHYDTRPRLLPQTELPIMEAAVPYFVSWVEKNLRVS